MRSRAALVIGVLATSSSALAQPPVTEPVPVVAETPQVVQSMLPNLFATSYGATIEARFDYSDLDGADVAVLNALLRVQYLTAQGFGGYVGVPVGFIEDSESLFGANGGGAIGNVEVGGLFLVHASERMDMLFRGGVAIDTAPEDDDIVMFASTTLPRLVDTYTSALQTTWGRAQGQLRFASNNLRLGAALGMDIPLAGDAADSDQVVGIINAIGAVGVQQNKLGLGASLVLVRPITEERAGLESEDEIIAGLNLGGDYLMNPNARFIFTIGLSLEDNAGGNSFGIGMRFSTL